MASLFAASELEIHWLFALRRLDRQAELVEHGVEITGRRFKTRLGTPTVFFIFSLLCCRQFMPRDSFD